MPIAKRRGTLRLSAGRRPKGKAKEEMARVNPKAKAEEEEARARPKVGRRVAVTCVVRTTTLRIVHSERQTTTKCTLYALSR